MADNWRAIDERPIPSWFDEAKLGIFIHWGLYSVPAYAPRREEIEGAGMTYSEWYAYQITHGCKPFVEFHERVYGAGYPYEEFAGQWKAELFRPEEWAELFAQTGAGYLGIVSKHHDGFCLFPSSYSPEWNSAVIGPHRDLVGELLDACEKKGIRRGVYYSLTEWKHPLITGEEEGCYERYALEKMIPEMKELVTRYRPEYLFTDGEWCTTSKEWHSREFLEWLIRESPVKDTVVFNDRWGKDTRGVHGGYFTSEYGEVNSKAVDEEQARSNLSKRKWEECRGLSHSFAFNRNEKLEHYLTERELLRMFVDIVSRGGNFILNVGPCADGTISPIMEERLRQLGDWMRVNRESVLKTHPCRKEVPEGTMATENADAVYLHYERLPERLALPGWCKGKCWLLGYGELPVQNGEILLPRLMDQELPCRCLLTLKLEKGVSSETL